MQHAATATCFYVLASVRSVCCPTTSRSARYSLVSCTYESLLPCSQFSQTTPDSELILVAGNTVRTVPVPYLSSSPGLLLKSDVISVRHHNAHHTPFHILLFFSFQKFHIKVFFIVQKNMTTERIILSGSVAAAAVQSESVSRCNGILKLQIGDKRKYHSLAVE